MLVNVNAQLPKLEWRAFFAALRDAPVSRGCARGVISGSQWLKGARKSNEVGIIGSMKMHLSSRSSLKSFLLGRSAMLAMV